MLNLMCLISNGINRAILKCTNSPETLYYLLLLIRIENNFPTYDYHHDYDHHHNFIFTAHTRGKQAKYNKTIKSELRRKK
jgi:hypothetical protein